MSAARHILLVEDNPGDVRLTSEALREAGVRGELHVVNDGEEALRYLRKGGEFKEAATPDLVLLDLNLPRVGGREVLATMKSDHLLRRIPVAVLTTSADSDDVDAAYANHVNCYITKPIDMDRFVEVIRALGRFWLDVVTLPR